MTALVGPAAGSAAIAPAPVTSSDAAAVSGDALAELARQYVLAAGLQPCDAMTGRVEPKGLNVLR